MKLQTMKFASFLVLFVILGQIEMNWARANPGRGSRSSFKVSKKSSNVDVAETPDLFSSSATGKSEQEGNGAGTSTSTQKIGHRRWLELEGIPPRDISVKSYGEVKLKCLASGSPPPMIYWLKNGKPIENVTPYDADDLVNAVDAPTWDTDFDESPNTFGWAMVESKLPFTCIKPEDQGEYSCVATSNGQEKVATTTITIEDEDSQMLNPGANCNNRLSATYSKKGKRAFPAFVVASETLHMDAYGNDILIPCRGAGYPTPHISWYDKNGVPITQDKKFLINGSGDLIIRQLSWGEMGEFTCIASNAYGSDTASTFVYPTSLQR